MLRSLCIFYLCLFSFSSQAKNNTSVWEMKYQEIQGSYAIYGGQLGDPQPPKNKDVNIAFALKGEVAEEIFSAIGPDIKDACTEGSDARVRAKDEGRLFCVFYPNDGYFCNFGFGLNSGKSIGGSLC